MILNLSNTQSLRWIQNQQSPHQISRLFRKPMRKIILQIHYFLKRLVCITGFEGRTTGEELVEYTAKGPEIGGFTGGFVGEEFGGDVFCGADKGVCAGGGVVAGVLCGGGDGGVGLGAVGEVKEFGGAKVGDFYSHA